jgi:hypothetical protein
VRARDAGNDDAFHLLILDILDDEAPEELRKAGGKSRLLYSRSPLI